MTDDAPCMTARVRQVVAEWSGCPPDEFGACHIVVSDFNIDDDALAYCANDARDTEADCVAFCEALGRLDECERFAVVLLLAGRTERELMADWPESGAGK